MTDAAYIIAPADDQPTRRKGFTLIELLVVVGIIAILAGVLIPVVLGSIKRANAAKISTELSAIGTALEAYKQDFGDYPRLPATGRAVTADSGSVLLAWALVGPYNVSGTAPFVDGADGLGFRIRPGGQGKVWGPYISPDKIKLGKRSNGASVLNDTFGTPILYLVAKGGVRPDIRAAGTAGDTNWVSASAGSLFNTADAIEVPGFGPTLLNAVKTADFTGPFVLWSAGPDGSFLNKDDVSNIPK